MFEVRQAYQPLVAAIWCSALLSVCSPAQSAGSFVFSQPAGSVVSGINDTNEAVGAYQTDTPSSVGLLLQNNTDYPVGTPVGGLEALDAINVNGFAVGQAISTGHQAYVVYFDANLFKTQTRLLPGFDS